MFTNSLSLEKEVERFRRERIDYFRMQEDTENYKYSKFMMLHIIPETFMDSNYNKQMYLIHRSQNAFSDLFSMFNCIDTIFPMIEGVRFTSYTNNEESRLYNNGIAECFYPFWIDLGNPNKYKDGYIPWCLIWNKIEQTLNTYRKSLNCILDAQRLFVCISIIGCKGAVTENDFGLLSTSIVDRDYLACTPIVINDFHNESLFIQDTKSIKLEFILSLGIRNHSDIEELIGDSF